MKKLIRNASVLALGLFLAAFPAAAGTWNVDIHAGYWNNSFIPYEYYSTSYSAPSGATVAWYGYAYNGSGAFTHVYATAPGVYIDEYVYANGWNSGQQNLTSAGNVSLFLETGAYYGGSTGCGVTIAW